MGKQLIFFRHGKSDWQTSSGPDQDRPLAARGIKAAQAMGKLLATLDFLPDLALTSPAVRAHTTLELARAAGDWPCPVKEVTALYEATPQQVLAVIQGQSDRHQRLLLTGHQPTWSQTTSLLIGGGQLQIPTAAMICLDLPVSYWSQVQPGQASLLWLLPPKLLSPLFKT